MIMASVFNINITQSRFFRWMWCKLVKDDVNKRKIFDWCPIWCPFSLPCIIKHTCWIHFTQSNHFYDMVFWHHSWLVQEVHDQQTLTQNKGKTLTVSFIFGFYNQLWILQGILFLTNLDQHEKARLLFYKWATNKKKHKRKKMNPNIKISASLLFWFFFK